jgi:hypothetical protein
VVPGHRLAAVRPNSDEPAARTGWARAEGDLWGPWARFRRELGAEVLPAKGLGGVGYWAARSGKVSAGARKGPTLLGPVGVEEAPVS